jgi:cytidylate kinase
MERKISPLKKAHDAFVLDTTNLGEEEAIKIVVDEFNRRIGI